MRLCELFCVFILMVLCPRCRKSLPGTDTRGLAVHQAGPSCKKKSGSLGDSLKRQAVLKSTKKIGNSALSKVVPDIQNETTNSVGTLDNTNPETEVSGPYKFSQIQYFHSLNTF